MSVDVTLSNKSFSSIIFKCKMVLRSKVLRIIKVHYEGLGRETIEKIERIFREVKNRHPERGNQNSVDDRGSVPPSGDQIKVVMETRSGSKERSPGILMNKPYE